MVLSDTQVNREAAGEAAAYVRPEARGEVLAALENALEDVSWRRTMQERERRRAELFLRIRRGGTADADLHVAVTPAFKPQAAGGPPERIAFPDISCEFRTRSYCQKSTPNFGGSERFVYLCVRKITTNETTYEYPLT